MLNSPNTNTALDPQDQSNNNRKDYQRGSGFSNINRILDANQGAGQKMGQQIGGQLTNQANSVREGIQSSQNQFNTQKNQAAGVAQNAIGAGQGLIQGKGAGVPSNETNDQYSARLSQSTPNYSQIGQDLRAAQYNGPMGLQNAQKLQSQAATTAALGRLAGNTEGQTELLKSMVARPGQYNQGQSALDSLLLGQSGQKAIQAGRQPLVGLQDKAMGATSMAENQANALKTGIANNKAQTLSDLQNAVTGDKGLMAQAKTQADQYNKDSSDLSSILAGTYDTSTPEGKQRAAALVDKMGDFGLDSNYSLYDKDPDSVKKLVGQLAATRQNGGTAKYTDNQSAAGQNLASVLADQTLGNTIKNNKFNTDVFGNEDTAFNTLNQNRNYDTETKNILTGGADTLHTMKQNMTSGLPGDLQKEVEGINSGPDEVYYDSNGNQLPGPRVGATVKSKAQLIQEATDKNNQRYNSIMNQTHGNNTLFDPNLFAGDAVKYENNRALGDMFSGADTQGNPYGFLAYGDRGDADVGKRFQGLGLTTDAGATSGTYRNEQQFRDAAGKALGPDAQMKAFVLNKILGLNQGQSLDPNGGSVAPNMQGNS